MTQELEAAPGEKETWEAAAEEAAAGTESPASTCSFSIFWGDMVAAFINENDIYMCIHIYKDTYICILLPHMTYTSSASCVRVRASVCVCMIVCV